jgi:rubrerythrin
MVLPKPILTLSRQDPYLKVFGVRMSEEINKIKADLGKRYIKVKKCYEVVRQLSNWECLKCGYKWQDNSEAEPRFCPLCGLQQIMKK